ncbi:MAG: hypothetical protein UU32_C0029G0003 [Candidatus Woesebacteria bacterium GW2011_GWB1_41_10]|uniref:Uncharacterized protein n=1 Tax=Candidatus Woesebacteria bacterium GW2011_GWB1_41_10 TaxID=1618577 RepID=A0A0G0UA49_9BACT|nr:MAG: hypothetical protein UU32_C0029G0003 [Candidatus Woesebacteria bacterium GW2011_GWB1_41_10]
MLTEERRNRQKAFRFIILTIAAGLALFFYGIPALGHFAAFISELAKSDKPISQNDKTPPAPPQMEDIPEFTKEEILKVSGKSEEGATVKITFNGKEEEIVADSEGNFGKNLDLKKGENTLTLSAKDTSGNESVKTNTFTVFFDNETPKLSIDSPSDGSSFFGARQRQVDIKGSVDDAQTKVTINDRFVAVEDNGSFQFTTTLSEGENKFTAKAEDKAENLSEKSFSLNFTSQ